MRILFILEYYHPHIGGVETFFSSLIKRLDEEGHHCLILTNRYDAQLPAKEQIGTNISIIRPRYFNRYGFTFFAWWAAMKYARNSDLIHTTSYNAAFPAWIAARLTRTKSVITFHERWGPLWFQLPWMSYPSRLLHYSFEWLITKLHFDRFVGVSEYTCGCLKDAGVKESSITRIYNGIDYTGLPHHMENMHKKPFTFLFFGRVGVAKGMDVLIDAYRILIEKRTDHQLLLVLPSEKTPLLKLVKKEIDTVSLASHITVNHDLDRTQLMDQIAAADGVIIPSYSEGFCFAAAETMAIGTPIISSGRGALKEVVSGKHITIKEFTPATMATAMSRAIDGDWDEDPKRLFPLEKTIDQYLSLYSEVLL